MKVTLVEIQNDLQLKHIKWRERIHRDILIKFFCYRTYTTTIQIIRHNAFTIKEQQWI